MLDTVPMIRQRYSPNSVMYLIDKPKPKIGNPAELTNRFGIAATQEEIERGGLFSGWHYTDRRDHRGKHGLSPHALINKADHGDEHHRPKY